MALANYTDLIASINASGGWLHRNDLSAIVPDWITLAEVTMNYGDLEVIGIDGLRVAEQETVTTLTTTGGTQTVALPSNFLEMRKVYILYSGVRCEMPQGPIIPLRPDEMSQVNSVPKTYSIVGSSLYLTPIPDQSYSIVIDYYAKIGPLTAAAPTNWLMTAAPGVYLNGAIAHGAPWLGSKFDPSPWLAAFRAGMGQVRRNDVRKRNRLTQLRSDASSLSLGNFNILTGT